MPLYEYRCPRCRHHTEVLQRIGETGGKLRCPHCNEVGLERQASTFAAGGSTSIATGFGGPSCTGFT
jgi:putative FmdB family regulatory protein